MAQITAFPADRSADTRERLILAAEKLFAEQGVDAVSLRQVNAAAGQKNASAAHYHFGSKEELIAAIYEYRMARVNARRLEMFTNLDDAKVPATLRDLVEAVVWPMVEQIDNSKGGKHYIKFIAQVRGHPAHDIGRTTRSKHASAMQLFNDRALALVPHVPPHVFAVRFGLMIVQVVDSLADRHRLLVSPVSRETIPLSLFVSILVDGAVAGLSAPVSAQTAGELKAHQRKQA
ncbi:MAG: TetR/AcrR family transcriptional regulator [Rhodospirillaceae bacterium]|nr:TetR/AcrR family transcriptional regulator [Rhodospirillaceae bacterium]